MKYQQPYGAASDAAYVNGNPAAGVQGSIPPAAAFEHPQRELVNLVVGSGLTPSESDLTQVQKAVRSQRLNYFASALVSGTANAITLTLSPQPTTWAELIGTPLRVAIAATNTGAATLAIAGLTGTVNIVRAGGDASQAGDLIAGSVATLIYDGTVARIDGLYSDRLPSSQALLYSTAGTYSFVVPAGVYRLKRVTVIGAGGSGGSVDNTTAAGSGGGGGGEGRSINIAVTPGQTIPVVVGAPGASPAAGDNAGNAGGASSFGAWITATGGGPGGGGSGGIQPAAGAAGNASGGNLANLPGRPGGTGFPIPGGTISGLGGGSPSSSASGPNTSSGGAVGVFPGGGGAGASSSANGAFAGGAGAPGSVTIEW